MNSYVRGASVRLTMTFADDAGTPVDPTTVKLFIRSPGGVITEYDYLIEPDLTRSGAGVYRYHFIPTALGLWGYRWVGAGAVEGVAEGEFSVVRSRFTT